MKHIFFNGFRDTNIDIALLFPEVQIFGTEYVNTNSEINLLCNATSAERAPEYVEWFFNGDKIHTSHPHWFGRTEIVNRRPVPGRSYISELIIYRSTIADHGNYVCRSSDLEINSLIVHILNGKFTYEQTIVFVGYLILISCCCFFKFTQKLT